MSDDSPFTILTHQVKYIDRQETIHQHPTDNSSNTATMKIAITLLAFASTASAFAPSFTGPATVAPATVISRSAPAVVALHAGGEDEEEGFDLDLGEMFDM
jgi:hypothetical protein